MDSAGAGLSQDLDAMLRVAQSEGDELAREAKRPLRHGRARAGDPFIVIGGPGGRHFTVSPAETVSDTR